MSSYPVMRKRAVLQAGFLLWAACAGPLAAGDDAQETAQTAGNAGAASVEASAPPAVAAPIIIAPKYEPPTMRERFGLYLNDAYGPGTLFRSAFSAALDQYRDEPPEWRQGAAGYSRRVGSRLGRRVIQETIEFGGNSILGQDTRYFSCNCSGFWKRTGHAVVSNFTARTATGGRTVAVAKFAGTYGGAMIATSQWYPNRYSPYTDGIRMGSQQIAISAGLNVLREFWPDIKRALGRR